MANEMYLSTAADQWVPEVSGAYADVAMAEAAVAFTVATLQPITSSKIRIPTYTGDPASAWIAEGAELSVEAASLSGVDVEPKTIAVLSKVSKQFFDDQGALSTAIIAGQGRDIGYKVDSALFGSNANAADQPAGLEDQTGVNAIDSIGSWSDLDSFAQAKFHAETLGEMIDHFVAHPDDALTIATLKDQSGSVRPLLGSDAAKAGATTVLGVPLMVSDAVASGTMWALPKRRVILVQRNRVVSEIDSGAYFSSLQLGLRSFARFGFAFTRPAAISKLSLAAASWTVTVGGSPSGGTFTLTYGGNTTSAIAYNATAATVKTALAGLDDGYSSSDWTVTGSAGGPYTVTAPAGGAITADGDKLTGGTNPSVTVASA